MSYILGLIYGSFRLVYTGAVCTDFTSPKLLEVVHSHPPSGCKDVDHTMYNVGSDRRLILHYIISLLSAK